MIRSLSFDSRLFGYAVGSVEVSSPQEFEAYLATGKPGDYDLVYVFSSVALGPNDKLFEAGVRASMVHENNDSGKKSSTSLPPPSGVMLNELGTSALDNEAQAEMNNLSLHCGHHSRFKKDPGFVCGEYNKLYGNWWRESLHKGYRMIMAKQRGHIVGMASCGIAETSAYIDLFSVLPDLRRQGIGRSLLNKVMSLAGDRKVGLSTQKENLAAMSFYEQAGFVIEKETWIYHWRPKSDA
ncbi:GNAT family N-acetyltransferase [Negadavirga shengliensis]|uniref:GNAT family N-acetyltransferase n=1 Tax=Negadavirga shengliensis TaxID=1389218 RepID=A0ABV9T569_9BACT